MGNKLGWIIAGSIGAIVVGAIVWMLMGGASGPSEAVASPEFLALKDVPAPWSWLGGEPAEEGNAGEDYHQAAAVYRPIAKEVMAGLRSNGTVGFVLAKSLADLNAAVGRGAAKKSMDYTLAIAGWEPQVCFNCPNDPADTLYDLAGGLVLLARHEAGKSNFDKAEAALRNALILGWHMVHERSRPWMAIRGLNLQREATRELQAVYEKWPQAGPRKAAAEEYGNDLGAALARYGKKADFFNIWPFQPGDITYIAQKDQDRTWRVQALLVMGILRHTPMKSKDAALVDKLLDKAAAGNDPYEAAAARAAKALTKQQYDGLSKTYRAR